MTKVYNINILGDT